MSETRPSRPPAGLGDAGRALWRSVAKQVAADGLDLDARERRWLADACAEADLIEVLEAGLVDASLMVRGSAGQQVINPLIPEVRQHREALGRLLARLALQDPDDNLETLAPRTRASSAAARALAMQRHHGRRPS